MGKKMSLILFDDIFFIFDVSSDSILQKSSLELKEELDRLQESKHDFEIFIESPSILVPEHMYESADNQLLLNQAHPWLLPSLNQIKVNTLISCYSKCVFYIPEFLIAYTDHISHLFQLLALGSENFFDQRSNGLWSLKVKEHLFSVLKVENALKDIRSWRMISPDDSTFHLLKMVEPYREHQLDFAIWTNENDDHHLSILSKYIPTIRVEQKTELPLLKELLTKSCVSYQEN
jgi:hypothetical protein